MDTPVKIVLIIMVASVLIIGIFGWAWVSSPTEFVIIFKVENRTLALVSNFTDAFGDENNVENVMKGILNKSFEVQK